MAKTNRSKKLRQTRKRRVMEDNKTRSMSSVNENAFEFHRNKVKHNVIGRRVAKNELGKPGHSRSKAMMKRKQTILSEYVNKHKSGRGVQDLRIKESDGGVVARKNKIYKSQQLPDDNNLMLTHKGKQLSSVDDNERISSDDEEIDMFSRSDFVENAHFGGFGQTPKSSKDLLNDIMDEKRAKKAESEANVELTEKLDKDWLSIKNLIRHKGVKHEPSNEKEDYDILVKQLMFHHNYDSSARKPVIVIEETEKLVNNSEPVVKKSVDNLFKEAIEQIDREIDSEFILNITKNILTKYLPDLTEKSLNILIEKYQTICEKKSSFSCKLLSTLLIGTHFKETLLFVQIIFVDMLTKIKFSSFSEIAHILVITKILLITSNGKYMPEVVNAIKSILLLATHNENVELTFQHKKFPFKCILAASDEVNLKQQIPVFKLTDAFSDSLKASDAKSQTTIKLMLLLETLELLNKLVDNYSNLPSFKEIFVELEVVITSLSLDRYPSQIKDLIDNLKVKFNKEVAKAALIDSRPKPAMLPMLEPKFDCGHRLSDKKFLVKKYKREFKGAQRELRKDSQFIRNTWLNETLANDARRKKKVNELMRDLADQQHIYKKKSK